MSLQKYGKSFLLISIIIACSVFNSSNSSIIGYSTSIDETRKNNNNNNDLTSTCNISGITCLDDIVLHLQKEEEDVKSQTDLIIDQVNSTKLKEWIDTLSQFHTRHTKSSHIENAAYWLKGELQTVCEDNRVFFQNYTKIHENVTYQLNNIICTKHGTASPQSQINNTIIIGAHYDSRAENINNIDARAPGADDNASGVSALLEIVRIISHLNLKNNIEFVLFSGEEQGQWGSNYYVKHLDDNNNNNNTTIKLYLNLDMIGYPLHSILSPPPPPPFPPLPSNQSNKVKIEYDVGNEYLTNDNYSKTIALFIRQIASNYTDLQANLDKLTNSDFIPFEEYGHTVIGIHNEGVTENPNYHKSSDTPGTLNIEYLTSITKLLLATILGLDNSS